ncbi:beta-ketoacyl-[acyl-carrier-protein] synthase family protein [Catenulispora yoronensis]|uniref:Beta-ketoacyl-[acyl-carrier-protein] synthase family protein n=1 Tax=Catenulispora yoronensis TaxID=450799 RepID=A0ABN2VDQ4_9ACTN
MTAGTAGAAGAAPGVVVTGIGATTPLGGDVPSSWARLLAGESGVRELPHPWAGEVDVRIAGLLATEPVEELGANRCRRIDRIQQAAVVAAREAWRWAGAPAVEPERLAAVVGTGVGGVSTLLAQDEIRKVRGLRMMSPYAMPMLLPNGPASAVALEVTARAATLAPAGACASGAEAIVLGAMLIAAGQADVAVVGGAEAPLAPVTVAALDRLGGLSRRGGDLAGAARPFAADRAGFVMAEGAPNLVLERADHARARGAEVLGVVAGHGVTSDAHHVTTPDVRGQIRAARAALHAAGLSGTDIAHVSAHATGTPVGDQVEADAIAEAVGLHPAVTSVKGATGHLLGGSGPLAAAFALLTMRDSVIPATVNLECQDPAIKLDVVAGAPRPAVVDTALVQAFGFGGHNVAVVLTKG